MPARWLLLGLGGIVVVVVVVVVVAGALVLDSGSTSPSDAAPIATAQAQPDSPISTAPAVSAPSRTTSEDPPTPASDQAVVSKVSLGPTQPDQSTRSPEAAAEDLGGATEDPPPDQAVGLSSADTGTDSLAELSPLAGFLVGNREGRISVLVRDFQTGASFERGVDERHVLASLAKVPIALAALEYERTALEPQDPAFAFFLHEMIVNSDNWAALALLELMGGESTVRQFLEHVDLPSLARFFSADDWGESAGTATEIADLFSALGEGHGIDPVARARLFGLLENVASDQRWGVSSGLDVALPAGPSR